MKIDFHVHTAERSSCATSLTIEQIQRAIKAGLDGIAITDHHKLVHPLDLVKLNHDYAPFIIYPGIEITADNEDFLVLGLSDPNLESENWSYANLHRYVRAQGGIIVLAHPYRYRKHLAPDVFAFQPDAIEIRSNNIRDENVPRIRELALKLNVPTLCNSDAHNTGSLGRYFNVFTLEHNTPENVFQALRTGTLLHSVN